MEECDGRLALETLEVLGANLRRRLERSGRSRSLGA